MCGGWTEFSSALVYPCCLSQNLKQLWRKLIIQYKMNIKLKFYLRTYTSSRRVYSIFSVTNHFILTYYALLSKVFSGITYLHFKKKGGNGIHILLGLLVSYVGDWIVKCRSPGCYHFKNPTRNTAVVKICIKFECLFFSIFFTFHQISRTLKKNMTLTSVVTLTFESTSWKVDDVLAGYNIYIFPKNEVNRSNGLGGVCSHT